MDSRLWHAGMLAVLALAPAAPCRAQGDAAVDPEAEGRRSVSSSGQFLVFGEDAVGRGIFCGIAEELRTDLLRVLKIDAGWQYPLVIQIHNQLPAAMVERHVNAMVRPTDDGFRFQVDVLLVEVFQPEEFNEEVVRLLMLERMLGSNPANRKPAREGRILPHWLHCGVLELVRHRRGGSPSELYESIMASHRILPIDDVIEGDPARMNSVTRAVFSASAAALVKALLGMDAGPQRLAAFMEGLPRHQGDERELLRRVYPGLEGSKAALEKWWALELAAMGRRGALDFLDPETTQERLQEALTVRYRERPKGRQRKVEDGGTTGEGEEKVCQLSEFAQLLELRKEDRAVALSPNEGLLLKLSTEAFPVYRPLISDYRTLLAAILEGRSRGLKENFKNLEEHAYRVGQQLRDLEDHMNWYEATQLQEKSGAFESYRRAAREFDRHAPRRDDRLSKYLDSVEERLPE